LPKNLDRSLDDVIDALRYNRNTRERGCSLLIGAGCSVTAGIKTAAGFVKLIKQHFGTAYNRASDKTYPRCMAELTRGQQRDLINEQVCNAKINWAHMAIAQLMRHGYVDRVLTTNFDPLVLRASAMLGEFPAVYDFALSQLFRAGELPEKAVFHLHGQSTGFVLMNTGREVAQHSKRLGPLFRDAGQARPWIVVGYSGDNDPVFDHLAAVERFDYGLYWVGFKEEEPQAHIREKLLQSGKDAYFVRGYDADRFFVELAQKLECFPPEFVERPFSFLKTSLSTLTGYRQLSGDKEIDILHSGFDLIDHAIADIEKPSIELNATKLLMAGKYEELDRLEQKLADDLLTPSLRDIFAWSHINHGYAISEQAETKSGAEADVLFAAAVEKYKAALTLKPENDVALLSWGNALSEQARTKSGAEADALFEAAGEKYEAAVALKPDDDMALWALLFWGSDLWKQAQTKRGAEADVLFAAAVEKYKAALTLKPENDVALSSWGRLYLSWSATKQGYKVEHMLKEAEAKLLKAEKIQEGSGSYYLARVAARRGDATSCQEWLERSREYGTLPDRQHLLADPDLACVRDQPWFQAFL
jgi:NAD-dependent SIR2 family protein deacetylase